MKEQERIFLIESNAIEGEFAPSALDDTVKAWSWAKKQKNKIDLKFILGVHKRLMININSVIAGNIRKCPIYVGNRYEARECLKPEKIEKELDKLISKSKLLSNYSKKIAEKRIKDWHIKFEKIHPFEDGNGRVGRIIMNIQRLVVGLPILIIHQGEEQREYYKWFKDERK